MSGCLSPRSSAPGKEAQTRDDESTSWIEAPATDAESIGVPTDIDAFLAELRRSRTSPEDPKAVTPPVTDPLVRDIPEGAGPPAAPIPASADEPAEADANAPPAPSLPAENGASRPALPVLKSLRVVTAPTRPADTAAASGPDKLSNQPADATPALERLSVDEYLDLLHSDACALDPIERAWQARFLSLALGRTSSTAERLNDLSPPQRDLLAASSEVVRAVRRVLRDPSSAAPAALEATHRLHESLSEAADLAIPTMALCRRVLTYGVYEPMPAEQFLAGRSNPTLLYCEVENFVCEATGDGAFVSQFTSRVELLTSDGRSVWQQPQTRIEDRCARRRRDFFIAHRLTLPPNIPAGEYVLKLTLEDTLGRKTNEATIPLTLGSRASLATKD